MSTTLKPLTDEEWEQMRADYLHGLGWSDADCDRIVATVDALKAHLKGRLRELSKAKSERDLAQAELSAERSKPATPGGDRERGP